MGYRTKDEGSTKTIFRRVWTSKDFLYRHLRVFGCLAEVHIAKDKMGKLDPMTAMHIPWI